MELPELKKQYNTLESKYKLPSFKSLNEDFEIDKIDKESDCLLRIVRKVIMEKLVNTMQFLDGLLNPVNTPRIYIAYIKSMSIEDKESIDKIYDKIATVSLNSLSLEIGYDEKKEAELIKEIYKIWEEIKPNLSKIIENIKNPTKTNPKKEKSYYS